jgi:hypothetical protein
MRSSRARQDRGAVHPAIRTVRVLDWRSARRWHRRGAQRRDWPRGGNSARSPCLGRAHPAAPKSWRCAPPFMSGVPSSKLSPNRDGLNPGPGVAQVPPGRAIKASRLTPGCANRAQRHVRGATQPGQAAMKIRADWRVAASLVAGMGLVACSSTPPATTTTAGTGSGFPTGGTGFITAGTGAAGTAATAGSTAPPAVQCGPTKMCSSPATAIAIPGFPAATPCCADAATGTCGTVSGTVCQPPPMPDPRCPTISVATFTLMPCCTATGMCGVDASALGMGCADLTTLRAFAPTAVPQRCDGMPLPMAGTGAAGAGGASGAAGSSGASGAAGTGGAGGASGSSGRGGAGGASGSSGRGGAGGASGRG